jgi:hypothetical protein
MSAGTDTSATALEWAMMHLVLDPAAQERLYDEVVDKVGKTARITEADVEAMPYLQVNTSPTHCLLLCSFRSVAPSHFSPFHLARPDLEIGIAQISHLKCSVEAS